MPYKIPRYVRQDSGDCIHATFSIVKITKSFLGEGMHSFIGEEKVIAVSKYYEYKKRYGDKQLKEEILKLFEKHGKGSNNLDDFEEGQLVKAIIIRVPMSDGDYWTPPTPPVPVLQAYYTIDEDIDPVKEVGWNSFI